MDGEDGVLTKCEQQEESPAAAYQRLKRDEWSEGAVGSLLDAYEEKWSMRNRAKLKGHDWEEVAKHVSARANHTKGPKTSTQCKNKIESMKKRYRSEVAAASDATSWPLFSRLDLMLRGGGGGGAAASCHLLQQPLLQQQGQAQPPLSTAPSLLPSPSLDQLNGVMMTPKEEVATEEKKERCNTECEDEQEVAQETESVTPKCHTAGERSSDPISRRKMKKTRKRGRGDDESREVGESVRWLAEVMLRSEQARADAMKEVEKIRAEVEEHKAQMELKRTEIIANTQLQIARLLVGKREKANANSSFPLPKK